MTRRRRQKRGFTLVELMISLVMGLIVALAAVGLARTATTTFYEQARISGVEANVRAASERLRNDLSRVAYMSTPSLRWDPQVARVPGTFGAAWRIPELTTLQGLSIAPADPAVRSHALTTHTSNALTPQQIEIAGNLTSDDVYRGQFIADAGGLGCGSAQIRLSADADAAVRRLFGGATVNSEQVQMTQLVFTPGDRMTPAVPNQQYAVQVMDMRGCFHYLTVCNVLPSGQLNSVVLNLAGGILTTAQTGGDVCGARLMEEVAIAPVHRVRWSLGPEAAGSRRIDTVVEGATAPNKFNLYRQLLAFDGVNPIGQPELIAEYAVDLKFGLIVNSGPPAPAQPVFTNIDFEANDALFTQWTDPTASGQAVGAHRVRSVRYRLAFRTPLPDRRAQMLVPPGPPYISRYCMGGDPCTDWARVRTVISEVVLFNQARADWAPPVVTP